MFTTLRNSLKWLPGYMLKAATNLGRATPEHIYFAICDHFEPYLGKADAATARRRLGQWLDYFPRLVDKVRDVDGRWLRYTFFYPEEEYVVDDMTMLAELCKAGYGEVEVHLHHHDDTSENLRRTLIDYKKRLYETHGLLSVDKNNGEISYGFIHGNWALNNSRRDGCWCGVNDEITILQETGCFADFTMPSAPSETQTRKVNSLYYAIGDPVRPRSHDSGVDVRIGRNGDGLLMVQGPLGLNWHRRKYALLPRLENGSLYPKQPVSRDRVECWTKERVHIKGAPDTVFIKLYNHGCIDEMIEVFLEQGKFVELLSILSDFCGENDIKLHFVTAREMVNVIHCFETGNINLNAEIYEFRYVGLKVKYQPREMSEP